MSSIKNYNIEEDNKDQEEILRFMQDLEFVQCLSNPFYLKYLADMGYFEDDTFINYLKYLLYFKKVEYLKYITYERCIIFLDLLQFKEFRQKLKESQNIFDIINKINEDWINQEVNLEDENKIEQKDENKEKNDKDKTNNDNNIDMDIEK